MGRALQGFSQEQGKGGGQLSAVEAPAPRQVSGPLGLGPGYPGAQVGHCWWEPALGSWRVSRVRACVTALMPPVRLFVPPGFLGRAWESSRLDTRPWGRLAVWPFGPSHGVSAALGRRGVGPRRRHPGRLTFGTVLARVARFTGAAVGPVAGQAVAAAPTGAGEAGVAHCEGGGSRECVHVARPPPAGPWS